jgi:cysteine synthase A
MEDRAIVWGPTYSEMLDPSTLPSEVREEVVHARGNDLSPAGLYRISWCDERSGRMRVLRLPPELTGVEANILVLVGRDMPSGSLKVGPAYTAVMEAELDGTLRPGEVTLVVPTSGNFGIGVAYVARLKGYRTLVLMPEGRGEERYQRIRDCGAELERIPCQEGDFEPVLHAVYERYGDRPGYVVLDQFSLMANYRFHRFVTGRSALEAAAGFGDGRVAAFVSAPGSAGTLAAGDEIKARFADAVVVAVEPEECPTLARGGCGHHRIEGIADGMVNLIHNLLNTDYVAQVNGEDCLQGLRVVQEGAAVLTRILGVPEPAANALVDLFGPSSICNILGAIKAARALGIPAGHNIVTVAPDGYDRYASAMAALEERSASLDQSMLRHWAGRVFHGANGHGLHDLRTAQEKERLFEQKEAVWTRLGYSPAELEDMKSPSYWEREAARVADYDRRLREAR